MANNESDLIGKRGELIFENAILDHSMIPNALFNATFLGEKWAGADYYVKLLESGMWHGVFFVQVKSTAMELADGARVFRTHFDKNERDELNRIPGPTYLIGVSVPTRRVFVRSIDKMESGGIYSISTNNELTIANRRLLYSEVKAYWDAHGSKPLRSVFK